MGPGNFVATGSADKYVSSKSIENLILIQLVGVVGAILISRAIILKLCFKS